MRKILILILTLPLLFLSSCRTQYVEREVPVEVTKTEYVRDIRYDSVYVHDSVDRLVQGDTVVINKVQTVYRERLLLDTMCIRDSVPVYVTTTEIREVNSLLWYQKVIMYVGMLAIMATVLYVLWRMNNK